jgi:2-methylisocitrate lyase-like PEP mutase family enzyme
MSSANMLRQRLRTGPLLVAPGVADALSAVLAEQAGFEALFLSGSALATSLIARPDVGLLSVSEVADAAARVADRVSVPLFVDGDSGFGNAAHVQRTVRLFEQAGAAGVQLEDQAPVKPAGDLLARPVIAQAEMVGKIKAAVDARRTGLVVSARTDAAFTLPVPDAIARVVAYAEAGADMVFVEGLASVADMQALIAAIDGKAAVLHNLLDGGRSPLRTTAEVAALGYRMALFPAVITQAMLVPVQAALAALRKDGATAAIAGLAAPKAIAEVIGGPAFIANTGRYEG